MMTAVCISAGEEVRGRRQHTQGGNTPAPNTCLQLLEEDGQRCPSLGAWRREAAGGRGLDGPECELLLALFVSSSSASLSFYTYIFTFFYHKFCCH